MQYNIVHKTQFTIRTNRYMFRHWSVVFRESTNGMDYKSNMKFGNAQKAKAAYNCQDTKENLYKTDAAIWLNKVGKYLLYYNTFPSTQLTFKV